MVILVLNCGSSSIKYQVIDMEAASSKLLAKGLVERIGLPEGDLTHKPVGKEPFEAHQPIPDHTTGISLVLKALTDPQHGVIGSLDEVIRMCGVDDSFIPCVDFGHLNAREGGIFFTDDDYTRVIERLAEGVGEKKCSIMHVHFSKIQYTANGELRHLTFDDDIYGPNFEPLMEVFAEYKLNPYIVCESAGTQTRDALMMKKYYDSIK